MSPASSIAGPAPLSITGFVLRMIFFAGAPFAIVAAAALFPMRGALIDCGLALGVFVAGEAARERVIRVRPIRWLFSGALRFDDFYREKPPKPFLYYLLYPLLFPYWLVNRRARAEFWTFRGYTAGAFFILVVSLVVQYFQYWSPDLGLRAFLPAVGLTLGVETFLVLSLLMPIATTVISYHSSGHRRALAILLVTGVLSTAIAVWRLALRRDPVVSYSTRDRVRLRTKAVPRSAHKAMMAATRIAWHQLVKMHDLDGDGKVEGVPLELARTRLSKFFKSDEAAAFDLWGAPRRHPRILVLYFEARPRKPPIWVAIGGDGRELKKLADLPRGATIAMRKANDGTDPLLPVWPKGVD